MTVAFIAHRFGRAYGPDNSRVALEHSLARGVHGLETDCCLTSDGDIVLLHDTKLDVCTSLTGWAHERPLDDLLEGRLRDRDGALTDQAPIALGELLDRAEHPALLQLEIKATADAGLAERTAEVVCERVASRSGGAALEIISFWPQAVAIAARHGLASRLIVACAYLPDALAAWAAERGVTGVVLEAHYFDRALLDRWLDAGLSVTSGVVNDAWLLREIAGMGADAYCSDRPFELATEIAAGPV